MKISTAFRPIVAMFAMNLRLSSQVLAAPLKTPSHLRGLNSACGDGNFFVTNSNVNTWYAVRKVCECPGNDDDLQHKGNNWALTQKGISGHADKVCVDGCANLDCNSRGPNRSRTLEGEGCPSGQYFETTPIVSTWYTVRTHCKCPGGDDTIQNINANKKLLKQGLHYGGGEQVCLPKQCKGCN